MVRMLCGIFCVTPIISVALYNIKALQSLHLNWMFNFQLVKEVVCVFKISKMCGTASLTPHYR